MIQNLAEQKLGDIIEAIAAPTPSPGGGSAAAVAGLIATALVRMVSHLTYSRKKYASVASDMQAVAEGAAAAGGELIVLAEDDARAYEEVMAAYKLPKATEDELVARNEAIGMALRRAADVPLKTAHVSLRVMRLVDEASQKGNPNALTDAGVASLLAASAVEAALMNVRVNIHSLDEKTAWALGMEAEMEQLLAEKDSLAEAIRSRVLSSIT